ncbi:MAG: hypothetical protein LBL21_02015 [Rickettsiales bacterium]|jgi:hypothetical protein|nr:hypothetical protein [Rickettsiales bacterium]
MKTRTALTAQKLMNLYRSAFAIDGGWRAVNSILAAESDDAVVLEIEKLPCGKNLSKHISNLKRGLTKPDAIDAELLPYNGMMQPRSDDVDDADFGALVSELENFQPDAEHLAKIKNLAVVRQFGDRWQAGVRAILRDDSLIEIWRGVVQSARALALWGRAAEILSSSPSDLLRAEVQADMPEYETYLPMFGKDGLDALSRLRQFIL